MKAQLIVQRYPKVALGTKNLKKCRQMERRNKKIEVMETVHQGEFITEIYGRYEYA